MARTFLRYIKSTAQCVGGQANLSAKTLSRVIFRRITKAPASLRPAMLQLFLPRWIPSMAIGVLQGSSLIQRRMRAEGEGRALPVRAPLVFSSPPENDWARR